VRVATFNLLHGRSPADDRVRADRLAAAVREIDADVLALQEVDRDQPRSDRLDLTAVAAEAMEAVDARFVPALTGLPGSWRAAGGNEPADSPGYGIALLSRRPVRSWRVVRLPALPVRVPFRVVGGRPVLVRDEPRAAVVAEIDDGDTDRDGPITVAGTHLSYLPGWNLVQLRRLTAQLGDGPLVLLGDLNLRLLAARLATGMTPLARGRTFPAHDPRAQIDHVLGRAVEATGPARVHALPLSDHRALSVDVRRSGPARPAGDPDPTA